MRSGRVLGLDLVFSKMSDTALLTFRTQRAPFLSQFNLLCSFTTQETLLALLYDSLLASFKAVQKN